LTNRYLKGTRPYCGYHAALCYDSNRATGRCKPSQLPPGQALQRPSPLFKKLDDDTAEKELARLQA
jgi:hypothetical protein